MQTGLPIYSLDAYKSQFGLKDTKFVIAVYKRSAIESIQQQLLENGVPDENILTISDWRNNNSQYLCPMNMKPL